MSDRVVEIIGSYYMQQHVTKEDVMFVLNYVKPSLNNPDVLNELENCVANKESNPMSQESVKEMNKKLFEKVIPLYNESNESKYILDCVSLACGYLSKNM